MSREKIWVSDEQPKSNFYPVGYAEDIILKLNACAENDERARFFDRSNKSTPFASPEFIERKYSYVKGPFEHDELIQMRGTPLNHEQPSLENQNTFWIRKGDQNQPFYILFWNPNAHSYTSLVFYDKKEEQKIIKLLNKEKRDEQDNSQLLNLLQAERGRYLRDKDAETKKLSFPEAADSKKSNDAFKLDDTVKKICYTLHLENEYQNFSSILFPLVNNFLKLSDEKQDPHTLIFRVSGAHSHAATYAIRIDRRAGKFNEILVADSLRNKDNEWHNIAVTALCNSLAYNKLEVKETIYITPDTLNIAHNSQEFNTCSGISTMILLAISSDPELTFADQEYNLLCYMRGILRHEQLLREFHQKLIDILPPVKDNVISLQDLEKHKPEIIKLLQEYKIFKLAHELHAETLKQKKARVLQYYEAGNIENIINAYRIAKNENIEHYNRVSYAAHKKDPSFVLDLSALSQLPVVYLLIQPQDDTTPSKDNFRLAIEQATLLCLKTHIKNERKPTPQNFVFSAHIGKEHWATYVCNTDGEIMIINSSGGFPSWDTAAINGFKAAFIAVGVSPQKEIIIRPPEGPNPHKFKQRNKNICGLITAAMGCKILPGSLKAQEEFQKTNMETACKGDDASDDESCYEILRAEQNTLQEIVNNDSPFNKKREDILETLKAGRYHTIPEEIIKAAKLELVRIITKTQVTLISKMKLLQGKPEDKQVYEPIIEEMEKINKGLISRLKRCNYNGAEEYALDKNALTDVNTDSLKFDDLVNEFKQSLTFLSQEPFSKLPEPFPKEFNPVITQGTKNLETIREKIKESIKVADEAKRKKENEAAAEKARKDEEEKHREQERLKEEARRREEEKKRLEEEKPKKEERLRLEQERLKNQRLQLEDEKRKRTEVPKNKITNYTLLLYNFNEQLYLELVDQADKNKKIQYKITAYDNTVNPVRFTTELSDIDLTSITPICRGAKQTQEPPPAADSNIINYLDDNTHLRIAEYFNKAKEYKTTVYYYPAGINGHDIIFEITNKNDPKDKAYLIAKRDSKNKQNNGESYNGSIDTTGLLFIEQEEEKVRLYELTAQSALDRLINGFFGIGFLMVNLTEKIAKIHLFKLITATQMLIGKMESESLQKFKNQLPIDIMKNIDRELMNKFKEYPAIVGDTEKYEFNKNLPLDNSDININNLKFDEIIKDFQTFLNIILKASFFNGEREYSQDNKMELLKNLIERCLKNLETARQSTEAAIKKAADDAKRKQESEAAQQKAAAEKAKKDEEKKRLEQERVKEEERRREEEKRKEEERKIKEATEKKKQETQPPVILANQKAKLYEFTPHPDGTKKFILQIIDNNNEEIAQYEITDYAFDNINNESYFTYKRLADADKKNLASLEAYHYEFFNISNPTEKSQLSPDSYSAHLAVAQHFNKAKNYTVTLFYNEKTKQIIAQAINTKNLEDKIQIISSNPLQISKNDLIVIDRKNSLTFSVEGLNAKDAILEGDSKNFNLEKNKQTLIQKIAKTQLFNIITNTQAVLIAKMKLLKKQESNYQVAITAMENINNALIQKFNKYPIIPGDTVKYDVGGGALPDKPTWNYPKPPTSFKVDDLKFDGLIAEFKNSLDTLFQEPLLKSEREKFEDFIRQNFMDLETANQETKEKIKAAEEAKRKQENEAAARKAVEEKARKEKEEEEVRNKAIELENAKKNYSVKIYFQPVSEKSYKIIVDAVNTISDKDRVQFTQSSDNLNRWEKEKLIKLEDAKLVSLELDISKIQKSPKEIVPEEAAKEFGLNDAIVKLSKIKAKRSLYNIIYNIQADIICKMKVLNVNTQRPVLQKMEEIISKLTRYFNDNYKATIQGDTEKYRELDPAKGWTYNNPKALGSKITSDSLFKEFKASLETLLRDSLLELERKTLEDIITQSLKDLETAHTQLNSPPKSSDPSDETSSDTENSGTETEDEDSEISDSKESQKKSSGMPKNDKPFSFSNNGHGPSTFFGTKSNDVKINTDYLASDKKISYAQICETLCEDNQWSLKKAKDHYEIHVEPSVPTLSPIIVNDKGVHAKIPIPTKTDEYKPDPATEKKLKAMMEINIARAEEFIKVNKLSKEEAKTLKANLTINYGGDERIYEYMNNYYKDKGFSLKPLESSPQHTLTK